ncbi:unnamed protein product, partial [marine sediment metagenome]
GLIDFSDIVVISSDPAQKAVTADCFGGGLGDRTY